MGFWSGFEKRAIDPRYLAKPTYRTKPIKSLDPNNPEEIWSGKIDGAMTKIEMKPGALPALWSHRISKKTGKPIPYNSKLPHIKRKGAIRAILEGETYATGPDGLAVAPEIVTAILNSGEAKSLALQKRLGLTTHTALFNILRYKGQDVSSLPYGEKRTLLEQIVDKHPDFTLPDAARDVAGKKRLLEAIRKGLHPQTKEGIIVHDANTPAIPFAKAKLHDEHDVYVRGVFYEKPTTSGRKPMAAGFEYSWEQHGDPVGRVGTGFSHAVKTDMMANPLDYIGRVARVKALSVSRNGVLQKPSFHHWHVEKNLL